MEANATEKEGSVDHVAQMSLSNVLQIAMVTHIYPDTIY